MTVRLSKLRGHERDELINAFKELEKELLVAKRQIRFIEYEMNRLKNFNKIGNIR